MSREEEDAQVHDEQAEQVAQGVHEDVIAAPVPDDNAEDEKEAQQPRGVRDPGHAFPLALRQGMPRTIQNLLVSRQTQLC